jgi:enoyl-CoA hydratase/carnithine racemase
LPEEFFARLDKVDKTMDYQEISYEVQGATATLTLDRPDALNAFTARMMHEVLDAIDRVDADDAVRALVVTGRGRGFCAGADLSGGGDTFVDHERDGKVARDGGGQVTLRLFDCTKPVIAAINGPAVGVGITMTLPMDVRLASNTARFGFVFAKRGLVPEAASSWFLPRVVGISQAAEWVYTGRVFGADEALEGGLIKRIYEPDELLPAAYALAEEIAANTAPVSIALSRRMLWRMLGAEHPMEAHRVDSRAIASRGRSGDVREGVASFLEKRPPHFPDRIADGLPDIFPGWEQPEFS